MHVTNVHGLHHWQHTTGVWASKRQAEEAILPATPNFQPLRSNADGWYGRQNSLTYIPVILLHRRLLLAEEAAHCAAVHVPAVVFNK